jgi:hypothetical protein
LIQCTGFVGGFRHGGQDIRCYSRAREIPSWQGGIVLGQCFIVQQRSRRRLDKHRVFSIRFRYSFRIMHCFCINLLLNLLFIVKITCVRVKLFWNY